jgi:hypothetical protein
LNWFDLVRIPLNFHTPSLPETILDLTQLSAAEELKLKVSVISVKHKKYFKEITMISHGTSWSWTSNVKL